MAMKLFICPTCDNPGLWDWDWLIGLLGPDLDGTYDGPCGTFIPVTDAIDVPDDYQIGDPIPDDDQEPETTEPVDDTGADPGDEPPVEESEPSDAVG